jgi:hypothetical protein
MGRRVLFICIQNCARSQMAEALLDKTCGEFLPPQALGLNLAISMPSRIEFAPTASPEALEQCSKVAVGAVGAGMPTDPRTLRTGLFVHPLNSVSNYYLII